MPALNLAGGIVGSVLAATRPREPPFAPFSCVGRVPGYYADITTNCKVISQIVAVNLHLSKSIDEQGKIFN